MSESNEEKESHLRRFWNLVSFRRMPENSADITMLIQVEMMQYHTSAVICRMSLKGAEKYLSSIFVKEPKYFCAKTKLLIHDTKLRDLIDILVHDGFTWSIDINLEQQAYLTASWKHW